MEGDQVVADQQYEFRSFLAGAHTNVVVTSVEGLLSMAELITNDIEFQDDHGMVMGRDRYGARYVVMEMSVLGSGGIGSAESALRELRRAYQSTRTEQPFVFKRKDAPKQRIYARVTRRDFPSTYDLAHGRGDGTVELRATDPRIYTDEEFTKEIIIPNGGGAAAGDIYMNGDFEYGTWPTLELGGPCTNPRIALTWEGESWTMAFDLVLGAGQTAFITTQPGQRKILVGGVNQYTGNVVRVDNEWWALMPALNQIAYNRSGGGAPSSLKIHWRDAFS